MFMLSFFEVPKGLMEKLITPGLGFSGSRTVKRKSID
jgi:hypothetical protein